MKKGSLLYKLVVGLFVLPGLLAQAQLPADLPWAGASCANETIILQSGIAAVIAEQWSFGLIDINGTIGGARSEAFPPMYHHPSWTMEQIGNVYGIAINDSDGCIFLTASSNYGAGFLGQPTVINYGSIGGGADDLGAAGTVYKIDGVTGQASVFAQLPQQSASLTHQDCEGNTSINRLPFG